VSRGADLHRQIADLWELAYLLIALEDGAILEANGQAAAALGLSLPDLLQLRAGGSSGPLAWMQPWLELSGPEGRGQWRTALPQGEGPPRLIELRFQWLPAPAHDPQGARLLLVFRQAGFGEQARLRDQLNLVERQAGIGSWELTHTTGAMRWSEQVYALLELQPDQVTPCYESWLAWVHPEDRQLFTRAFHEAVASGSPFRLEHRLLLADGREKVVQHEARTRYSTAGHPQLSLGTVQDMTAELARQRQLEQAAFVDPLTGLANKAAALRQLRQLLLEQPSHCNLAVVNLDLDGFQGINDSLGIEVGNQVLIGLARRLRHLLGPGDFLARLASDEFVLIRRSVPSIGAAQDFARALQLGVSSSLCLQGGLVIEPSACVGVSVWPEHASDGEELLQCANTALMVAKQRGRRQLETYSTVISMRIREKLELELDLAQAIDRRQLELVYQPQVDGAGALVGAEALLRWRSSQGRAVPPASFIPLAEETGLIHAIGDWVIEQALEQLAHWNRLGFALPRLAINLSPVQLDSGDGTIGQRILAMLEEHRFDPCQLEFELTETAIQRDPGVVRQQLCALARAGCSLAVDDFGTGYSSLDVLHALPLHKLKIDRCFVDPLLEQETDRRIVKATIAMAQQLELVTLAEGVENDGQWQLLRQLGCDLFQGYLFGQPLPAEPFLARWRAEPFGQPPQRQDQSTGENPF